MWLLDCLQNSMQNTKYQVYKCKPLYQEEEMDY